MGMENPKIQSPFWCNKRTGRYCPSNIPVLYTAYTAENGTLGIFEPVENNGTAVAQKQCLCHKEAVGMENYKMHSPCRCNKRTGRFCPSNNPVLYTAYTAENGNLGIFECIENNGTAFAPK